MYEILLISQQFQTWQQQNTEIIANNFKTESIIQQWALHINRMTVVYLWDCSYTLYSTKYENRLCDFSI